MNQLDGQLYPFQSHYLTINGYRYHYLDEGQGEPIVMLHGNPTWSFYYRDLIKALRPDYRVIAPDHIGMGLSDKPGDAAYDYTFSRRLDDFSRFIDSLNLEKFTLVGHDWGGIIGTAYASLNPHKIKAMVMFNTAGFNWPLDKRMPLALSLARIPVVSALFIRGLNVFARIAVRVGVRRGEMKEDVAQGLLYPYGTWRDRIAVHRFVQDVPTGPADPGYELLLRMEARLKGLRDVPKLLIWGMKDFVFCPKVLDEWLRFFPDAEVHRLADAGHYVVEDAIDEIVPIVQRFLKAGGTADGPVPQPVSSRDEEKNAVALIDHFLGSVHEKPDELVVAEMTRLNRNGKGEYATLTYRQADKDSSRIAHGLEKAGLRKGMHTVFMVTPGTEFFSILAGILKVGAIPILVDPGMGMRNLRNCIDEAAPEAFIGIPRAQLGRILFGWGKKSIKLNVTAGPRLGWGGFSLNRIKSLGSDEPYVFSDKPAPDDMALLAYTSGNTGVPKGVGYTTRMLEYQLTLMREIIGGKKGAAHLATFPPFALFAPACGVPAIIPIMDATKPAKADPRKLIAAIRDFQCNSIFCSPALIEKIGRYCEAKGVKLPSLARILSAGAPARMKSIARFEKALSAGTEVTVLYGATEALPLTAIGSAALLRDTRKQTDQGGGICVGLPFAGIQVAIIGITEEPIPAWTDDLRLPANQIGEIVARGPVVSAAYYNLPEQNARAKIRDSRDGGIWHRMGDVGYLDTAGRLWMCGRKAHRVETPGRTFFSLPCEAIFNTHPKVYRSALVGVKREGQTVPAICVELEPSVRLVAEGKKQLVRELLDMALGFDHTRDIRIVLFHPGFPVDIRHNAKILREKLALWAREQVR